MEMAQQIQDRTDVVKGVPVVEPSNKFFWFNRPDLILFLIHFTLFQNAFQMAYFLWIWYEFGLTSCFHENLPEILTRVFFGVALQILCSYITFPLYSLVTQMGSHMKKAIFEEQTAKALKKWQKAARDRKKLRKPGADISSSFISGENTPSRGSSPIHLLHKDISSGFISGKNTPSRGSSPIHLLHKFKPNTTHDLESALTSPPRAYHSETELSEIEGPTPASSDDHEPRRNKIIPKRLVETHSGDFSFAKP